VKINFFIVLIIAGLSLAIIPSYAQTENLIEIETASSSYEQGEPIVISGHVNIIIFETPLVIQIFYENNLIEIAQLSIAQDGSFTHTVSSDGKLWSNSGDYIIRASYGEGNIIETSFDFITEDTMSKTEDSFEVDAGSSGTFDVEYTIRGATIENMVIDPEIFALIVIINSEDSGSITLELPRDSIDAKKKGCSGDDETFIILIDGIEVPYEIISTMSDMRTIKIEFEEEDSDIEIIGTCIIPEFGTITMLILAVTIISVIFLSKNKSLISRNF